LFATLPSFSLSLFSLPSDSVGRGRDAASREGKGKAAMPNRVGAKRRLFKKEKDRS